MQEEFLTKEKEVSVSSGTSAWMTYWISSDINFTFLDIFPILFFFLLRCVNIFPDYKEVLISELF